MLTVVPPAMSKTLLAWLPLTASWLAPGPVRVILRLSSNSLPRG